MVCDIRNNTGFNNKAYTNTNNTYNFVSIIHSEIDLSS